MNKNQIDSSNETVSLGNGIKVISFFTGAGGLDLGFDMAGFDVVYATDMDGMCCHTLRANIGKRLSSSTRVERADIRQLDPLALPDGIDLVIGGPPCQSFSASGRRAGGASGRLDQRGTLFEAYCRIIGHVKPKAFLFENVRGILGTNNGEDWAVIVATFRKLGYNVNYRILDALDYGAPQQRERMILVGHQLDGEFLFPAPLYGPDSRDDKPHLTAHAALQDLEDDEDKDSLTLRNGKYAHLLELVPPGENYLHFTAKRGYPTPIFAYRSRFSDFLYKANPHAPIKTLIASPGKYTGPFHWENRCFTVKEYMRLQGFPDDYLIIGTREEAVKQIGNSVSPKLSFQVACAIAKQVFKRESDQRLLDPKTSLSFDKRKGQKAKITRDKHAIAAAAAKTSQIQAFAFADYESRITPTDTHLYKPNCQVNVSGKTAKITIRADNSRRLFAKMTLAIRQHSTTEIPSKYDADAMVEVVAYGIADHTVQTMWNAVDEWVIRSSKFHSLFELYGHFTEPHPIFEITEFKTYSENPIAEFTRHVVNFSHCSKYFPRPHLTQLFGKTFQKSNFIDLVKLLRSYRFDIRCYETNIAIPRSVYMVTYPFTLPFGKQMNFSVRDQELSTHRPRNYELFAEIE